MHSYQKFKYSYINDNFRKSIKNITKGIIKIHYTTYKYTPQPQNKTNSCLLMKLMSTTIEASFPWCFMFFFDIRILILITPFVSSIFNWNIFLWISEIPENLTAVPVARLKGQNSEGSGRSPEHWHCMAHCIGRRRFYYWYYFFWNFPLLILFAAISV